MYLDELPASATERSLGLGIIQLVVTSEQQTPIRARQLLDRATVQFPDAQQQQRVIQLIETIVVYKFPTLSREEVEAMLGLSDLKQTRVYQEAKEEGRQEGKLETKLAMIPLLLELGLSIEQISQRLELDLDTVRRVAQQSENN
ncbi:Rpn family recombination-promoting nuclease/putative transposase [Oscillatoria salina IIICB1]|nr:Rpn family recombination-promoting nuclease/putative transposase [Oscillatoria salina IIICB1]NET91650.1 Rpn family recombination-promoting nuclease/putative transposase [Kamptonema sp. SIO1D9]